MRAAAMTRYQDQLSYLDVPDPVLRETADVIIEVLAAGVCGSDLHIRSGALQDLLGAAEFPYILGHENVGRVVDIAPWVTSVSIGDSVALHPLMTCGLCPGCRSGKDTYCSRPHFPGVDQVTQGGFAQFMATSERSCVRIPDGMDPIALVAATDAGLTGYHAVKRALPFLEVGQRVLVVGAGGVGQFVLQSLNALASVNTTVIDLSKTRLESALSLGAHQVLHASSPTDGSVWKGLRGQVDVVFDCVGTAQTLSASVGVLSRGGVLSIIGGSMEEFPLTSVQATANELTILGNYVGQHSELVELIALMSESKVVSTYESFSLQAAETVLQRLAAGDLAGRAVLIP